MPVRFAAHQAGFPDTGPLATSRLSGTVWQGQMQIDGGHLVTWVVDGAASLWTFGFAADWRLTGPGTDLAGEVVGWPGGVDFGPASGVAAWPLMAALMPGLPIACSGQARFAAVAFGFDATERTGSGTVTAPAGECARIDRPDDRIPRPALHTQISTQPDAVQLLVTPQDGARVALVTARLTTEDRLVVTVHREGAALVPGMPKTADSELDLPVSILLGG